MIWDSCCLPQFWYQIYKQYMFLSSQHKFFNFIGICSFLLSVFFNRHCPHACIKLQFLGIIFVSLRKEKKNYFHNLFELFSWDLFFQIFIMKPILYNKFILHNNFFRTLKIYIQGVHTITLLNLDDIL
jgi:hypothetical protein